MMTRITFLLSLLHYLTASIVEARQPPKLEPPKDQHVVLSGDFFELTCSGNFRLSWDFPASMSAESDGPLDERLNVTQHYDGNQFHSRLRLENATFLDTGSYSCKYDEDTNDWNGAANTYLYVYDPDHLIDYKTQTSLVNVHENDEAIIPCRPTHPNVTMSFFFKKGMDEIEISDSLNSRLFKYDPQVGLIITKGSSQFHQNTVVCKARMGTNEQKYNFIPNFHPEPVIRDTSILHDQEYPINGDNLTLTCRALFFQNYNPATEVFWNYDLDDPRINVSKQIVNYKSKNSGFLLKNLTITKLRKSDENKTFSCYLQLKTTTKTTKFKPSIYKLGYIRAHHLEGYIGNITWHGSPEIKRNSSHLGKPVTWIFDVFATPNPVLVWYDPKGHEIDHRKLEKYELSFDGLLNKIKLTINDVQVPDMGNYVLKIEVGNEDLGPDSTKRTKLVDMFLNIYSDPQVHLTPQVNKGDFDEPFYIAEKMTTFNCTAQGFPLDVESLQWTFQPCHKFTNCSEEQMISPEMYTPLTPIDGLINNKYHYKFATQLTVTPDKSGIYSCSVCNFSQKAKCDKMTTPVFVNDFSHRGYSIEEPENMDYIVEGDELTIACTASRYNFSQVQWFWKNTSISLAAEMNDAEVIDEETTFSYVSKIIFPRIRLGQGGLFVCKALGIDDSQDKILNTSINVLPKTEPVKSTSFNMNGSTITASSSCKGSCKSLTLDCSMKSGRPVPVISWTKDGQPFPESENKSHVQIGPGGSTMTFLYLRGSLSGEYRCMAKNRAGSVSGKITLEVQDPIHFPPLVIGIIVCGCVVVLILSIVLAWRVRVYNEKYKQLTAQELMMFENGDPSSINPELGVDDQADLLPYDKKFEFPRESLKLGKQLGSGAFGRVLKAQAIGMNAWERSTTVAVKMVKPNADIMYVRALMAELKIMIHLGKHLNIVNLLGACTNGLARKELLVIVEYCRFGNLQKYLLQHRHHFIDQIDPITGDINFNIGQDMIDGYGNDLPRVREEEEMSAVYLSHANATTNQDGYLLPREQQQQQQCHPDQQPTRNSSIRYVPNPRGRKRTVSIQSDYNGCNHPVNTDMTTLPEEEEESTKPGVSRSHSTTSRASDNPGWRGNVRGDYDVSSVRPICTKDLICWAYQVTRGMEYLASKKVMHGDLACRNILLAQDNVVKICDFGLAKDIYKNNTYQKKSDGPLPIKWMAIESIRDRVFSTQSDVWAFGIVLWEMFSMGKTPYPGIEACDLYNQLLRGHRLEKPENCPQQLYQMMLHSWDNEPTKRPNFLELMDELGDLLEEGEKDHYLDLTKKFDASTVGANNTVDTKDYLAMMSPPDFTTQMSVSPGQDEDGYLQPRKLPLHMDNDEYLMPNSKNHQVIEMMPLMRNGTTLVT